MRLLKVSVVYETDELEDILGGIAEYTEMGYVDLDHVIAAIQVEDRVEIFTCGHSLKIEHDFDDFCTAWIG